MCCVAQLVVSVVRTVMCCVVFCQDLVYVGPVDTVSLSSDEVAVPVLPHPQVTGYTRRARKAS